MTRELSELRDEVCRVWKVAGWPEPALEAFGEEDMAYPTLVINQWLNIESAPLETTIPSIVGPRTISYQGYRVTATVVSGGTRWEPPDYDEVEIAEVRHADEAALRAAQEELRMRAGVWS